MVRRENLGIRSSPRLTKSYKRSNHNIEKGKTEYVDREELSSTSAAVSEYTVKPQSSSIESDIPLSSATGTNKSATSLRTTTSRRGGKGGLGSTLTARAASALKRSQQTQHNTSLREKEVHVKAEMAKPSQAVLNTQPSTAAAAAAAAAKALCDNSSRARYGEDMFRNHHEDSRSFRARRDESVFRITTRSKNGIQKPKIPRGSSTVRVMGSATPTHIARQGEAYPEHNSMEFDSGRYESPGRANAQSVFRKSPTNEQLELGLENSPQQILLCLKSGSKSFDLMKSPGVSSPSRNRNDYKEDPRCPSQSLLSPEAPPQIQHSHLSGMKSEIFFDPRTPKTPRTPKAPMVDFGRTDFQMTPSFSLFNQSFDSFGESGYLRSPTYCEGALIDRALPGTFSLEETPRKNSLMASPHLREFTFSPHKRKSSLDHFAPESPGISLDNCIVEAIEDATLLPRGIKSDSDPLMNSNVMVLDLNKTVRNIPTPTQCNRSPPEQNSGAVPLKKRLSPAVSLERRSFAQFHVEMHRGPPAPDCRMMHGPPLVPRHPGVQSATVPRESHARPAQVPSHIFRLPPAPPRVHQYARTVDIYRPAKRSTTLSGLNVEEINSRLVFHKEAFDRCTFLLPGFRRALQESGGKPNLLPKVEESQVSARVSPRVSPDRGGNGNGSMDRKGIKKAEVDKAKEWENRLVAGRRISSAICAFGGQLQKKTANPTKSHYTESIMNRYFEHENRISWDVEETPPIAACVSRYHPTTGSPSTKRIGEHYDMNPRTPKKFNPGDSPEHETDESRGASPTNDAPKMKYRCKLCGKPKQNHQCPYEKSLQRSIGITVHSAINAFSAAEPGILAPPLTEMNNFLRGDGLPDITPARPKRVALPVTQGLQPQPIVHRSAPHVTPEQMRPAKCPPNYGFPFAAPPAHMMQSPVRNIRRRNILSPEKNVSRVASSKTQDSVFVESVPLSTEQFRTISASSYLSNFEYPSIPLPYMQRKSLSDNLFELSKELPVLKEDCAIMLRQAREDDTWDVAVAELLTQVIVAIHCPSEDTRLEGLSRYLNSLGFAC